MDTSRTVADRRNYALRVLQNARKELINDEYPYCGCSKPASYILGKTDEHLFLVCEDCKTWWTRIDPDVMIWAR